jgi:hypothetical protein
VSPNQRPESFDSMTAAPEHHEVLLENDRVRCSTLGLDRASARPCTRIAGQAFSA